MNNKMQKLLSVLVVVLLLVSALPVTALAAESGSTTVTANHPAGAGTRPCITQTKAK